MSIAYTCIYDTLESCKYAKYWYGKPVVSKRKDCNRNPNNYPKPQVGTKDEKKDKISFALKDPILQQGFEIICENLAELDCQMNRNKYCHSCVNATDKCFRNEIGCPCEKYKSYKDENAELKEENKFLKEQCLILADGNVCNSTCSEIKKYLTKAKEIIKDYMTIVKGAHSTVCGVPEENRTIYVLKLNEEAEQFLNSEVVKND